MKELEKCIIDKCAVLFKKYLIKNYVAKKHNCNSCIYFRESICSRVFYCKQQNNKEIKNTEYKCKYWNGGCKISRLLKGLIEFLNKISEENTKYSKNITG